MRILFNLCVSARPYYIRGLVSINMDSRNLSIDIYVTITCILSIKILAHQQVLADTKQCICTF